jgi:hypothetical protein
MFGTGILATNVCLAFCFGFAVAHVARSSVNRLRSCGRMTLFSSPQRTSPKSWRIARLGLRALISSCSVRRWRTRCAPSRVKSPMLKQCTSGTREDHVRHGHLCPALLLGSVSASLRAILLQN